MRQILSILLGTAVFCSATALALTPAKAGVLVNASITSNLPGGSVPAGAPSSTQVDVSATGASGANSTFGHSYSYADGNIGSRSSGTNTYNIDGVARYRNTFTATTPGQYQFNYTLSPGDLIVRMANATGGAQHANVSAVITESVNGGATTNLLNYQAALGLASANGTPTFTETGLTLGAAPTLTPGLGDYTYAWDLYVGSVSLGTLAAGDEVEINYTITSHADGSSTGLIPLSVTPSLTSLIPCETFAGVGTTSIVDGCALLEAGFAEGRFGDPLVIENFPGAGVALLPEPASLGMLCAAIGGLAAMRRRPRRG